MMDKPAAGFDNIVNYRKPEETLAILSYQQ
jgi:hypothetical protein